MFNKVNLERHSWLQHVRKVAGEFALLITISAVLLLFYQESFVVRSDAARVPRVVIYSTGVFMIVAFILIYRNMDNWDEFTSQAAVYQNPEDERVSNYKSFGIKSALLEFSWSVLYVVGMIFIGFFTTNFLFTFAYMYYSSDKPTTNRVIEGTAWGVVICLGAYFLFIYILGNHVIFRLGILP